MKLFKKHANILESIFSTPTKAIIVWKDIEPLLVALGGVASMSRFLTIAGVEHA